MCHFGAKCFMHIISFNFLSRYLLCFSSSNYKWWNWQFKRLGSFSVTSQRQDLNPGLKLKVPAWRKARESYEISIRLWRELERSLYCVTPVGCCGCSHWNTAFLTLNNTETPTTSDTLYLLSICELDVWMNKWINKYRHLPGVKIFIV